MKNVYIYCEGQTEETFINNVLSPYFANMSIWVKPIVCTTKRTPEKKYRGGVSDYDKIKRELTLICKQHHNEIVTTMFDYYAMPGNTPMIDCTDTDIYSRIEKIENAINQDVGLPNCHFNFSLHEFEGLLFSNPNSFGLIADDSVVAKIQEMRDSAPSPEHINNLSPALREAVESWCNKLGYGFSLDALTNDDNGSLRIIWNILMLDQWRKEFVYEGNLSFKESLW